MDIYTQKSGWKILLFILALAFLTITMLYTNSIAVKLAEGEVDKVRIFENMYTKLQSLDDLQRDITDDIEVYDKVKNLPIILENESGEFLGWNLDGESEEEITDQARLKREVDKIKKSGYEPIEGVGYAKFIYYKNTPTYERLKMFPYLMILLVSLFLGIGYYVLTSARQAEQKGLWAGMAKETAHQLGTPISAIVGWIEHLKLEMSEPSHLEILDELTSDVDRLELVADRFSKIGSAPSLEPVNISAELNDCINYMDRRAPKRVSFKLDNKIKSPVAMINSHLFDWVIENLYRNALDAMDGQGLITTTLFEEGNMLAIDVQDTGKGIPSNKHKTIFQPGFSTKTRGWGLGLSLAKRIIENYHKGKIFVKQSKVDHGTTFAIRLPKP